MSITNDHLLSKVVGSIEAISKLPAKELSLPPTSRFGEDYNATRKLFIELNPGLESVLPPEVEIMDGDRAIGRYVEVLSYLKQLLNLLREAIIAQRKG